VISNFDREARNEWVGSKFDFVERVLSLGVGLREFSMKAYQRSALLPSTPSLVEHLKGKSRRRRQDLAGLAEAEAGDRAATISCRA
jgi:hypothetical protein